MTRQKIAGLVSKMPGYRDHQAAMATKLALLSNKFALSGQSSETITRIFTLANTSFQADPNHSTTLMDCPCNPDPGWGDGDDDDPQNPDNGDGESGNGDGDNGDSGGSGGGGGGGGWSPHGQTALQQALSHCYRDSDLIQKAIVYIGYCSGSSDPGQCIQDKLTDAGLDYIACVLSQLNIPF